MSRGGWIVKDSPTPEQFKQAAELIEHAWIREGNKASRMAGFLRGYAQALAETEKRSSAPPGASTVYVFDLSCGQLVHGQPGELKKITLSGSRLRYLGDLWEILFSGQAGIPISTRESPGALRNRIGRARKWLDERGIKLVANESHRIGIGKDGRITYQPSGTLHIPSTDLI
jgi:hypothetical protein